MCVDNGSFIVVYKPIARSIFKYLKEYQRYPAETLLSVKY